jgi:hypothetical protein
MHSTREAFSSEAGSAAEGGREREFSCETNRLKNKPGEGGRTPEPAGGERGVASNDPDRIFEATVYPPSSLLRLQTCNRPTNA